MFKPYARVQLYVQQGRDAEANRRLLTAAYAPPQSCCEHALRDADGVSTGLHWAFVTAWNMSHWQHGMLTQQHEATSDYAGATTVHHTCNALTICSQESGQHSTIPSMHVQTHIRQQLAAIKHCCAPQPNAV
jgi:hypothetical protein